MVDSRRAGDYGHDCDTRSGPPVVVAENPSVGFFDVADKNFLLWRGTKMRWQLRKYLVAFDLDERKSYRRERCHLFQKWLVDDQKRNQDDARTLAEELEGDLWRLQEGGPKLWRLIIGLAPIISVGLIVTLGITRSNEFATFVAAYGIVCLALGGLAACARFSDLVPKSHSDDLRIRMGLSRIDFIGLLGSAGIVATTGASYFQFTHLAYRVAADNQEIITVLKAILKKLP